MQVVLGKGVKRLISLFCRQIRPRNNVLMNANGSIHFATAPKKAAECEMGLDRLVIDSHHFEEMFQCLVGLLVEQEI